MLALLLESALRSVALGIALWLAVQILRVRNRSSSNKKIVLEPDSTPLIQAPAASSSAMRCHKALIMSFIVSASAHRSDSSAPSGPVIA
jgi:hypothetical protein